MPGAVGSSECCECCGSADRGPDQAELVMCRSDPTCRGVVHVAHIAWWGGGQGEGDGRCSVVVAARLSSSSQGSGQCKPVEVCTDSVALSCLVRQWSV